MCRYQYKTPDGRETPDTPAKICPYPRIYDKAQLEASTGELTILQGYSLPIDGEGLCLFHSNRVDWKRLNDFTGHFQKITQFLSTDSSHGQYDFSGFIFVGTTEIRAKPSAPALEIAEIVFQKKLDLSHTRFVDSFRLESVDFAARVNCQGAAIEGDLEVTDVRFCGLDLSKATIACRASFTRVQFTEHTFFEEVRFGGQPILGRSVEFRDSRFGGITSFVGAKFDTGPESQVRFHRVRFEDFLDFERTSFCCQIVFEDTYFGGVVDFLDTSFDVVKSKARYRGFAVEFNNLEIPKSAVVTFKSTTPTEKMFNHDVVMNFKVEPTGLIYFENVNFSKISSTSREVLNQLARSGNVEIGAGCIKYRHQTDVRRVEVARNNAPLILELCQTFTNYFAARHGANLGFEIVARTETDLQFFYFTDENIPEAVFYDRLANAENSLWYLLALRPDSRLFAESQNENQVTKVGHTLINAVDGISAMLGTFFRVGIRVLHGTWGQADTRNLLEAVRFETGEDTCRSRAESLHDAILRNYTLGSLARISARQHLSIFPAPPPTQTILFLGANPSDKAQLALHDEAHEIDLRLRSADFRDAFRIEQHWEVQAEQLPSLILRFKPTVVHFCGHGTRTGELILLDSNGHAMVADREVISRLFSILRNGVRCVFLNACYSSAQAEMIAEHVEVVVGMSSEVEDRQAIVFASSFYETLAYGKDIQTAFELAKTRIDLSRLSGSAIPSLYCQPHIDLSRIILVTS